MAISVFKGTRHCSAGCTLGDMVVEGPAIAVPAMAAWFGYGSLVGKRMKPR